MSSLLLTNLNQNDFCDEAVLSAASIASIHGLCAKIIHHASDSTREQIAQIYRNWKNGLDRPSEKGAIRYYPNTIEEGIWTLTQPARDSLNAAVTKAKNLGTRASRLEDSQGGVDFPIWFSAKGGDGKPRRVMIIAQDPLRKEEDFLLSGSPNDERIPSFLIGTPFALHDMRYRRQSSIDSYWSIIDTLRLNNCHVYVTDLFKVYQLGVDLSKGGIALPFFCDVLHAEAKLFEPDVVVTFGRKACQALGAIKVRESFKTRRVFEGTPEHPHFRYVKLFNRAGSVSQYPVVPLLHPSGSARGSRKEFRIENSKFLENCDGSMFTHLIFKALDMARRDNANSASESIVS